MPVPFFNDLRGSVSHPTCSAPRRAGTDWGLEAKRQNVETRERRSCWCENPFSYPRTRSALPVRPGLTAARRWASRITYAVGVSEHSPGSVRRRRAPPWVTDRMDPREPFYESAFVKLRFLAVVLLTKSLQPRAERPSDRLPVAGPASKHWGGERRLSDRSCQEERIRARALSGDFD